MPPAIHKRITVSAVPFPSLDPLPHPLSMLAKGAPAASAANVAALEFLRKSLLFQFLFMRSQNVSLLKLNQSCWFLFSHSDILINQLKFRMQCHCPDKILNSCICWNISQCNSCCLFFFFRWQTP